MTAYYPYRAFKTRPYFKQYLELPIEERGFDTLMQMALFGSGNAFGPDGKHTPISLTCRKNEAKLSTAVGAFFAAGQPIFHITPKLREAFLHSDLGDATGADLKFPFKSIYVHLGNDLGYLFNDGAALLEGVLLSSEESDKGTHLQITIVGELTTPAMHWGERGLESFSTAIGEDAMNVPLMEAITTSMVLAGRDPLNDPKRDLSDLDEEDREHVRASWQKQADERSRARSNMDVVIDSLRLCANALLYISQYPEDAETEWQEGTPSGYREKYERSDGKARERVLSKARSGGFTRITKVGRSFERFEASEEGASPSPHLRRAHWRRQRHGQGGSLRKLIWIRATRVLGGSVRERAYLMAEAEGSNG